PMKLEVAAVDLVEFGPEWLAARLRLGAATAAARRGGRHEAGEAGDEILLADAARFLRIELVEPRVGQCAQLVAADLLIGVLVSLGDDRRRQRRTRSAGAATATGTGTTAAARPVVRIGRRMNPGDPL